MLFKNKGVVRRALVFKWNSSFITIYLKVFVVGKPIIKGIVCPTYPGCAPIPISISFSDSKALEGYEALAKT
jgi:hypothetical protein